MKTNPLTRHYYTLPIRELIHRLLEWDRLKKSGTYICGYGCLWHDYEAPRLHRALLFRIKHENSSCKNSLPER